MRAHTDEAPHPSDVLDDETTGREATDDAAQPRSAVDRRTDTESLLEAWRAIHEGRWTVVAAEETGGRRRLLVRTGAEPIAPPAPVLTPREREIADRLVRGVAQKVIAIDLAIAPSTVAFHTANLARKLGATTTPELVRRLVASRPRSKSDGS